MITNGKYVSIVPIIEKVYRDMGSINQLNFGDAIEWVGEAIEFIGAPLQMTEKVAKIEICGKRGRLPSDLHMIITAGAAVNADCNDCDISFTQMRYSTDTYHMYVSCCGDCNCTSSLTYKVNDDYIFTNFDEGVVRMAYRGIPVDKNGYPLIPDDVKFKNAVAYHVMWKLAFIMLMQEKISRIAYEKIERDRDWYIAAAQTRANTPSVDMMESIKNNWIRLIKKINQQGDGFKSAGEAEQRITHNSTSNGNVGSPNCDTTETFFNYTDSCNAPGTEDDE